MFELELPQENDRLTNYIYKMYIEEKSLPLLICWM